MLLLMMMQPPHEDLLQLARNLRAIQQFSAAVVIAQTAVEVYFESVIVELLRLKGVADLEEPISALVPNFNPGGEKLRKLYVALTGDEIQKQGFWSDFMDHVRRRNDAVHRGVHPTDTAAGKSIDVAKQLIDHVETAMQKPRSAAPT